MEPWWLIKRRKARAARRDKNPSPFSATVVGTAHQGHLPGLGMWQEVAAAVAAEFGLSFPDPSHNDFGLKMAEAQKTFMDKGWIRPKK